MNELKINGRVTNIKKVETKTGTSFTTATLVTARKDKKTDSWINNYFNLKCFNTVADEMSRVKEKTRILLDGKLNQENYTDKNGEKKSTVNIMVKSFIIEEVNKDPFVEEQYNRQNNNEPAVKSEQEFPFDKNTQSDDDDSSGIPF